MDTGGGYSRQWYASSFLRRTIPGIRVQTAIAARLFRVPRSFFLFSTALSASVWIVTCFSIGFILRCRYEWLIDCLTDPLLMAAIVLPPFCDDGCDRDIAKKSSQGKLEAIDWCRRVKLSY